MTCAALLQLSVKQELKPSDPLDPMKREKKVKDLKDLRDPKDPTTGAKKKKRKQHSPAKVQVRENTGNRHVNVTGASTVFLFNCISMYACQLKYSAG